ncbi:arylsulfatase B isoform X2 [Venturia canescens]|nr:arylsulfatase B-like isoform X2 [Venturia canescens]
MIKTPNIDALAYTGLILNNYYVTPICTPSRSALMTGKHPIHTGMQQGVLKGAERRGLPLSEKLLPEYLRELGYVNYIVGKWHLGFYKKEYTPTYRGFKKHVGFWTGHQDYSDHTAVENHFWGLDMRRDLEPAWDLHGRYSTDVFTGEAIKIINNHNTSDPLFLYLAHTAVHSGNPYNPLPAPDDVVEKFDWIPDYKRRRFAAMLHKLDRSVGDVIEALKKRDMLADSLIVFSTDNGGPAAGFNLNAASNWPLRGVKNTLWEGGVRGVGVVWSPKIGQPGRVSNQLFHITDWLPTLLSAAEEPEETISSTISSMNLDGMNLWKALKDDATSPRQSVLHNIDDAFHNAAITKNGWKLLRGITYSGAWDRWYESSEANYTYVEVDVIESTAGRSLTSAGSILTPEIIRKLRFDATLNCEAPKIRNVCRPTEEDCLFNVSLDPCEFNNVAKENPEMVRLLGEELKKWNATAIKPSNKPLDPKGNPKLWNYTWTNFGDYEKLSNERTN